MVLELPSNLFDYVAPAIWPSRNIMGICVVDTVQESNLRFFDLVEGALHLIKAQDELRFARLNREIRLIVHLPVKTGAQYSRLTKTCSVDLRKMLKAEDRQWSFGTLACILVHESTHGYLYTRRIVQTGRNYPRVERLCCNEMRRFAKKACIDGDRWELKSDARQVPFGERVRFVMAELSKSKRDKGER